MDPHVFVSRLQSKSEAMHRASSKVTVLWGRKVLGFPGRSAVQKLGSGSSPSTTASLQTAWISLLLDPVLGPVTLGLHEANFLQVQG